MFIWIASVTNTDEIPIQVTKLPVFGIVLRRGVFFSTSAARGREIFFVSCSILRGGMCWWWAAHESDDLKMANITPQDAKIAQYL